MNSNRGTGLSPVVSLDEPFLKSEKKYLESYKLLKLNWNGIMAVAEKADYAFSSIG